jgi:hypothetical protein
MATLTVYRDFANRAAGEPDDGSLAWRAHLERQKVLEEAFSDDVFAVRDWGVARDPGRPHELAQLVIDLVKEPTAAGVAFGAGAVAIKLLLKPLEKRLEAAVEQLYSRLFAAFRRKRIGDFAIEIEDGTVLACRPDGKIAVQPSAGTGIADGPAE